MTTALTSKQEVFAQRYAIHGNAAQAAREAGYADVNSAYKILRKPEVANRVDALQAKSLADNELSAERVVAELGKLGMANIADYIDRNGKVNLAKLERGKMAAIVEYTQTTSASGATTTKIKLADKLGALDRLGKVFGAYAADNQQRAAAAAIDVRQLARRVAFMLAEAERDGRPAPIDVTPVSAVDSGEQRPQRQAAPAPNQQADASA